MPTLHVSDFTQAGDKIILDLINEDNNSALALTVVSVALASAGSPTTKNTLATVTSLPGSGYSGSVNLEYNRLAIGDFVDLYYPEGLIVPQGNGENLYDFLPEINAGLAVNLTAADLADQPLAAWTGVPNESQEVNAAILAGSLVYTGTLTFTVDANDIPLSSVVTVTVLDGMNLPESGSGETVENTVISFYGVQMTGSNGNWINEGEDPVISEEYPQLKLIVRTAIIEVENDVATVSINMSHPVGDAGYTFENAITHMRVSAPGLGSPTAEIADYAVTNDAETYRQFTALYNGALFAELLLDPAVSFELLVTTSV